MGRKASFLDYVSTGVQIFFLTTSLIYVLLHQYLWKTTDKLGRKRSNSILSKASRKVNSRISKPLATGKPDEADDSLTIEDKKLRCFRAMNGAQAVHSVVKHYFLKYNPLWHRHIEYEVPAKELSKKTYIYMGNHTSYADFIFLAGLSVYVAAVGKADLLSLPVAGKILKNSGFLPVHFLKKPDGTWGTNVEKTKIMLQDAVDFLRYGVSVLVFPEGTINLGEDLGEFKPGFFKVAKTAEVDVVPFAIWGAEGVWPMKSKSVPRNIMSAGSVFIKIGTPMSLLDTEECVGFKSVDQMKQMLTNKYKINFTDERQLCELPVLIENIVKHNEECTTETKEYERAVQDVFKLTVRKRVFEMRCEMQIKHQQKI